MRGTVYQGEKPHLVHFVGSVPYRSMDRGWISPGPQEKRFPEPDFILRIQECAIIRKYHVQQHPHCTRKKISIIKGKLCLQSSGRVGMSS